MREQAQEARAGDLFASGAVVVAGTKAGGHQNLKFAPPDSEPTPTDPVAVLDLNAGHAEQYPGDSLDNAR